MSNDGRLVQEMWLDSGEAAQRIKGDENHLLKYICEYHGDHDCEWILMIRKSDGIEVERHNPRYASTIIWEQP